MNFTDPSGLLPGRGENKNVFNIEQYTKQMVNTVNNYSTSMAPSGKDFSWSILEGNVSSAYGFRTNIPDDAIDDAGNRFEHWGIDLAPKNQNRNDEPFYAIQGGIVTRVDQNDDSHVTRISITDKEGNEWVYMHGDNTIKEGMVVLPGERLGYISNKGFESVPNSKHVHIEFRSANKKRLGEKGAEDPVPKLGRRPKGIGLEDGVREEDGTIVNNKPVIPQYPPAECPEYNYMPGFTW